MAKITVEVLPDLLDSENYYNYPILSNSGFTKFWIFLTGGYNFTDRIKPITLRFGQLFHTLTYTPQLLTSEDLSDINSLEPKMKAQLNRMVEAARNNPTIKAFLKHRNIIFEKPVYFTINGFPLSIRPDALIPKLHGHDLKSTACTTQTAFEKSCVEYKYFRQMYLYQLGTGCKNYIITGVSKKERRDGTHETFTVDICNYSEQMKEAKIEALEMIRLYDERYPDYKEKALKLFAV